MGRPRFDPALQGRISEQKINRVSDHRVVDVEENDEVLLRLLDQVLHLLLESAHKTIVHLHLRTLSPAQFSLHYRKTRTPRLAVIGEDGLDLPHVNYRRSEVEYLLQTLGSQDMGRVLEIFQLHAPIRTSISSAFFASTACSSLKRANYRLISLYCRCNSSGSSEHLDSCACRLWKK